MKDNTSSNCAVEVTYSVPSFCANWADLCLCKSLLLGMVKVSCKKAPNMYTTAIFLQFSCMLDVILKAQHYIQSPFYLLPTKLPSYTRWYLVIILIDFDSLEPLPSQCEMKDINDNAGACVVMSETALVFRRALFWALYLNCVHLYEAVVDAL